MDIDLARLKPAAVEVILDGRTVRDPKVIEQVTTFIAARGNWDLNDYSIQVLPQPQNPSSTGSEQPNASPAKAPAAEYSASAVTGPDNNIRSSLQNPGSDIPTCPYRGLFAFWEEDAEVFFGRESLIQRLEAKLEQKHIVQVSGPSGSGKSSLVAAGLIPALKRSGSWQVVYAVLEVIHSSPSHQY
jgi:ABC-type glutathione transport system ATPase component